jgi:hypothetical protein
LGGREEDRHSYFINVSVKGIEKKTNKIVSQEGQGLFELNRTKIELHFVYLLLLKLFFSVEKQPLAIEILRNDMLIDCDKDI